MAGGPHLLETIRPRLVLASIDCLLAFVLAMSPENGWENSSNIPRSPKVRLSSHESKRKTKIRP